MSEYTWPDAMNLTVKNKIGIGTTNPEAELHVLGKLLGAAQDTSGNSLRICCGKTPEGSTNWQPYDSTPQGIYVDVDTSACGFKSTPYYIVNLHGNSSHWIVTGGSAPYFATAKGFRIYLRFIYDRNLTPDFANHNDQKWHIQWLAIGN
ncbi:MAG: hypothetical protein F6K50_19520 [Moorea sp. SIO3I7]|uniref:hypothetical protein n=1 Tax=unclassified Moorena TaxID=2683338 RepID=UPI0013C09E75|nr:MULTISPECIES: hypothetical protein [unclassified Moorena]NEN97634.1 hypothetical protein [Moorena sp. SIO3I7]NEO08110.1 hypothetical protein [Moorena sp. SIO3I8]NEP23525.1 hypothetical protein [Moorena sp. SIO3I6]